MSRNALLLVLLGALALMLASCVEPDDYSVGESSAAAWVPRDAKLWPFTYIKVCFEPYSESGDPTWNVNNSTYIQRTKDVRKALEDAVASIPNTPLRVYGWDTCPPGGLLQGWRVSVQDSWDGASADVGYDPNKATGVALGINATMGMLLHEFGHALGFEHEYYRDDIDAPCPDTGDLGTRDGYYLTPYDPDSIMNGEYCGVPYVLSPSDKIAVSFMYPEREPPMEVTPRIAFAGGYAVPSIIGIDSGWGARGILRRAVILDDCVIDLQVVPAWQAYDTLVERSNGKLVEYYCHFHDYWNRQRTTAAIHIITSKAKFTSVLTAVL